MVAVVVAGLQLPLLPLPLAQRFLSLDCAEEANLEKTALVGVLLEVWRTVNTEYRTRASHADRGRRR